MEDASNLDLRMTPFFGTSGPHSARIAIVGEAWGAREAEEQRPFVGYSGMELDTMLREAGIDREQCFVTNVLPLQPPGNDIESYIARTHGKKSKLPPTAIAFRGAWVRPEVVQHWERLQVELDTVKPEIIIAVGDTAHWALMEAPGVGTERYNRNDVWKKATIGKWRGSVLRGYHDRLFIPTYHPAAILRRWSWRWITVQDFKRVNKIIHNLLPSAPLPRTYLLRPSADSVLTVLDRLEAALAQAPIRLSVDLETRKGAIACFGLAWSATEAICIPFLAIGRPSGYWDLDTATHIVARLRTILTHPNARVVGQNLLYDYQYIAKFFGFYPRLHCDTMVAMHTVFLTQPKDLAYICSIFNTHYIYWKDDGKEWDPKMPEERLWSYNCDDACFTWEASVHLENALEATGLAELFASRMRRFPVVLRMMLRGVRVDKELRNTLLLDLLDHIAKRKALVQEITGFDLTGEKGDFSTQKLQSFFYGSLGLRPIYKRTKEGNRVTIDEDALEELAEREPLVRKIAYAIIESRSLKAALNVVRTPLDSDGRMRCSYNMCGTITTRYASSENAFGNGTNLQNISLGGKSEYTGLQLPNLRRLLVPSVGHVIVDVDLDRADLQVVVWEANDAGLKTALRRGFDMHLYNVRDVYGVDIPDDELLETNPRCEEHKLRYKNQRHACKAGIHATNYYCQPNKLSKVLNCTVREAERFQQRWFDAHPGVSEWHRRTQAQLDATGSVRNVFGYICHFFDRPDDCLTKALAWTPQSTVAETINRAIDNLDAAGVEVLLQVHDSTDFEIPERDHIARLSELKPLMQITIPYADPLIIPIGFKVSAKSWGDVKRTEVPDWRSIQQQQAQLSAG